MIPKRWRKYFDSELRERMQRAEAAAIELQVRKKEAEMEAEVGAVANSRPIQEYRVELLAWGEALVPGNGMSANDCYWFRRGLERAVGVLDEKLATDHDES